VRRIFIDVALLKKAGYRWSFKRIPVLVAGVAPKPLKTRRGQSAVVGLLVEGATPPPPGVKGLPVQDDALPVGEGYSIMQAKLYFIKLLVLSGFSIPGYKRKVQST